MPGSSLVAGVPTKLLPAPWQLTQPVLKPVCTIEGGAVPLALLNRKLLKVVAAWQLSQAAVPKGM